VYVLRTRDKWLAMRDSIKRNALFCGVRLSQNRRPRRSSCRQVFHFGAMMPRAALCALRAGERTLRLSEVRSHALSRPMQRISNRRATTVGLPVRHEDAVWESRTALM
jgi:hypothetical protein